MPGEVGLVSKDRKMERIRCRRNDLKVNIKITLKTNPKTNQIKVFDDPDFKSDSLRTKKPRLGPSR